MDNLKEDIKTLSNIWVELQDNYSDPEWDLSDFQKSELYRITGMEDHDWDDCNLGYYIEGMERAISLMKLYSSGEIDIDHVNLNMLEFVRLNEIKARNRNIQLDTTDQVLSILIKSKKIGPDTSLEELEETQNQVRAIINDAVEKQKLIEEDKKFLKKIMDREKI